jgi:hypothetical protein
MDVSESIIHSLIVNSALAVFHIESTDLLNVLSSVEV